jgi:hypothetical protein
MELKHIGVVATFAVSMVAAAPYFRNRHFNQASHIAIAPITSNAS